MIQYVGFVGTRLTGMEITRLLVHVWVLALCDTTALGVQKEKLGPLPGRRPAGVYIPRNELNRPAALDLTVTSGLGPLGGHQVQATAKLM
eukprot:2945105-Amphidinium_carterae.2